MDRKGVEMSVNTVIIIVLALLVVLVIAFFFIRSVGSWNTASNCASHGGTSEAKITDCKDGKVASAWSTGEEGRPVCCVPLGSG